MGDDPVTYISISLSSARPDSASRSGVALKVVVDVDCDTWIRSLVGSGNRNLGWRSAATAGDLDLCTTNVELGTWVT